MLRTVYCIIQKQHIWDSNMDISDCCELQQQLFVLSIIRLPHTHRHTFNGPFPELPRSAGTWKVKPIWILLKQETVSGSGISWAVCKCAPRSRQITTPAPHYLVFTGRMPFLPPNQQCQSTEGTNNSVMYFRNLYFVALNWWNMTQSGAWHVVCNSGLLLVK